jgi:hypothetical protein
LEKNPGKVEPEDKAGRKRLLPKAQVDYNIITNNDLEQYHWKGVDKPEAAMMYKKNINMKVFRDYNIINNQYWEGQKEKSKRDRQMNKDNMDEKFWKTHDFNPLVCSYYDQGKEGNFQENLTEQQKNHGKNFNDRLPPTLKVRETIVFDPNKDAPEEVKAFDLKKKNQKRRYELRYELENQYRDRDVREQDHNSDLAINRYNGEKFYEEALKGYDNITLKDTDMKKYTDTANVKPKMDVWQKIEQTKASSETPNQWDLPPVLTDSHQKEIGFHRTRFPQYVHADVEPTHVDSNVPAIEHVSNTPGLVHESYERMLKDQNMAMEKTQKGIKFEPYHKNLR